MNKKRELIKNTIILTIGKICTQFVSFLLLPLYTTLLRPEEYGVVDLLNTYVMLLVPIFNWQFENGLFRFMIDYRKDRAKQKKLFSTIFIFNIIQCLSYLVLFGLFNRYIHTEFKYYLALDVIGNIILNTLLQFPRGIGDNLKYSIASFISAASIVVLNVFFIAILGLGANGMFIATILGKVITIIYLIRALKIWTFFSFHSFDRIVLKDVSKYSLPLVPNQLSWWVVGASDRTVVSYFIDVATNGVYSVAHKFSSVYSTFCNIFYLSWSESVSMHLKENDSSVFLNEVINETIKIFIAVDYLIIASMPILFPLLVNSQYAGAYNQIPILMLAALFQALVGLTSAIYVALKKSVEIAKTSIFAAIINIVVDLLLIRFLGLYAASVSTLVAYSSMAIYRCIDVKKYVSLSINKETIIHSFSIGVILLITYYSQNFIISSIMFLVIMAYGIVVNRNVLLGILTIAKNKIANRG